MIRPEDVPQVLYEQDPDDGCWVYLISADLVKLMAEFNIAGVPELTKRLANNLFLKEQLDAGTLDIPIIEQHLKLLKDLCNHAITRRTSLLFYLSN